ncbi:hypothetical protein YC2023_038289 [Brassica napus]
MVCIATTTNHVISWCGSIWNGQRRDKWIAPTDLLSDKRRWITIDDSRTQDHLRPRTKIDKVSESVYSTKELGSITHTIHRFIIKAGKPNVLDGNNTQTCGSKANIPKDRKCNIASYYFLKSQK